MSRLDYITIAIVGICILAIIFLVYKMTDLFSGGETTDKIETVQDTVELEDDGIYDYEIDDAVDSTAASGQPATEDSAPEANPAATTPATQPAKENTPATKPAETDETPATKTSSGGKFMVFGGTFTKKAFADEQVAKLKKLGYGNANVEIFDRGKYAVVMVDRFDYMADAERLVTKLKADGINCYIKMKER